MCGITGILDMHRPVTERELDRFTDALAHRGPDGRSCVIDDGIGLGHRRLAILDLAEDARDPRSGILSYGGADGRRYRITYDGRVYNFPELRRELEGLGHSFRTNGDAEVVLVAYAQWGISCLERFNGMWAFAIWDREERRLFLARDRFGVKPLYFQANGPRLAFASEMKAFLALEGFTPALDPETARAALATPLAIEGTRGETLMRGVRRLLPGQALAVQPGGQIILYQWWDTKAHLPQLPAGYVDQVVEFRSLFVDAVRLRLRSDVPVGVCLGGGLDSGAVASATAWLHLQPSGVDRTAGGGLQAFAASFPGSMAGRRSGLADQMLAHIGGAGHRWAVSEDELLASVIDTVWAQEELHPNILAPHWSLYRKMRERRAQVSLEGCGADELLGGHVTHLNWPMTQLNDVLFQDFHQTLLPSILRNHDRCAMANGVEARMPFMDWRLVCFAFALAGGSKIGGGHTKRILRDAMIGLVPDGIRLRRTKPAFGSPLIEWYNGGLASLIRQVVTHPLWLESPFWDGPGFRDHILTRTVARAWTPADEIIGQSVWTMINLVLWQILFIEKRAPAFPWR